MMFLLGSEDPLVPLQGGRIGTRRRDRGAVWSAADTLDFYANRNGCSGKTEAMLPDLVPDDGVRVREVTYQGCVAPLQVYRMEGGGHVWPGRPTPRILKRLLGTPVFDITGEEISEAFLMALDRQYR